MSSTVPAQHPAVVLRSSYQHLRAVLALAVITILSLTIAVTVLAIDAGTTTTIQPSARPVAATARAHSAQQIGANPDQLGPQPSPYAGPVVNYPGHF